MDQINEAIFGRRPSGFGDLDVFARRGSLDSTTAVFDAAIMDLTRRRLSMAGGMNDPLAIDPIATRRRLSMAGGMNDPLSIDPIARIGSINLSMGNMGTMNPIGLGTNPLTSSLPGQAPASSVKPSATAGDSTAPLNLRQQQLQEKQRELELRQKELEIQRRQLMTAMEERRRAMNQLHNQVQLPQNQQMRKNSLSNLGSTQGLLMGLQSSSLTNPKPLANESRQPQWFVCKICNAKAFSNREEALAHESFCMMSGPGAMSRSSIGTMRRGSLDLLGTLASANPDLALSTLTNQTGNGPMYPSQRKRSVHGIHAQSEHMSNGPFAVMEEPLPLAMDLDKEWLTPLHCFLRRHCVHVFTATERDVATPSKGKRKPIHVGQVGIRCPHCHHSSSSSKERGSVYYPTSIASIYNATMNLLQRHLHSCSSVPPDIMKRYETLKGDDARSGTSKKYWVKSAVSLGLVDTPNGIRYSGVTQPIESLIGTPVESGEQGVDSVETDAVRGAAAREENSDSATTSAQPVGQSSCIVTPEDEPYGTSFSYHLMSQMQPCVFAEADRLGKRKGLPPGFPGLACTHCFGGYGSGRFFPSSIKTLSDTSKTLNVLHNHMMRCRKCPVEVRENLTNLRKTHDEERARMKFGSQKAFFARIWDRLHYKDPSLCAKRKFQASRPQEAQPLNVPGGNIASAVAGFQATGITGVGPPFGRGNVLESLNMQYGGAMMHDSNKRMKMS